MKKYERIISFRTLYLAFVRRFRIMLLVFVSIALVSTISTLFLMPKSYSSKVSLKKYGSVITETQYEIVQTFAKSSGTISKTADNLKEKGITHANKSEITVNEISSGLVFEQLGTNSIYITYYFHSKDSSITMDVISTLTNVLLDSLKNDEATSSTLGYLSIAEGPTGPTKSNKNIKYFLVGNGVGLIFAIFAGFVFEVVFDEIYDKRDLEYLECSVFELDVPKKKE